MSLFFENFQEYARHYLYILTKSGEKIRFTLNDCQKYLWHKLHEQQKKELPVRAIVLKPRQVGISTFCSGFIYHRTIHNPYVKSCTIAHDLESSSNIFDMSKRFYDFTPALFRPMQRYSNKKELVFENPNEKERDVNPGLLSQMIIETAGKKTAGRSATIHNLHISELALWPDAKETFVGLTQSVPKEGYSVILIESTAKGMSGNGRFYYELCQEAMNLENDFEFIFIPWSLHKEYCMSSKDMIITAEEAELQKIYKWSADQIAWRRWKIRNDFKGDEVLFRQEYPACPEEAFILTGRPVFNQDDLVKRIKWLSRKHERRGDLDSSGAFVESAGGNLLVFEPPNAKLSYVVGADVAEGIEGGDYSTAFVMDKNFRQVAQFKGHIDPDLFGKYLVALGRQYNNALLAPEVNNHGHATLAAIKNLNYSNIYKLEIFDDMLNKMTTKLGWRTTVKTKMAMLDEFRAVIRDNSLKIRDPELFKEMLTLQIEENGDIELTGKDLIVSAAIAVQSIKQVPMDQKYVAKRIIGPQYSSQTAFQTRMRKMKSKPQDRFYD